jgi:hypothetical protein
VFRSVLFTSHLASSMYLANTRLDDFSDDLSRKEQHAYHHLSAGKSRIEKGGLLIIESGDAGLATACNSFPRMIRLRKSFIYLLYDQFSILRIQTIP